MLKKQAKVLTDNQVKAVLSYLETTRNPKRDKAIFMLSIYAGLRAKEISNLEISMITDVDGNVSDTIALEDKASKGKSGRVIPMNKVLRAALIDLLDEPLSKRGRYVISTERAERFSANGIAVWFQRLYRSLGFEGASSHSGRRMLISQAARNISRVGGSIRDVMVLAGHKNLSTTQRYIEQNAEAQRALIDGLYSSVK